MASVAFKKFKTTCNYTRREKEKNSFFLNRPERGGGGREKYVSHVKRAKSPLNNFSIILIAFHLLFNALFTPSFSIHSFFSPPLFACGKLKGTANLLLLLIYFYFNEILYPLAFGEFSFFFHIYNI